MSELNKYRRAISQIFRDVEARQCLETGFLISEQGHVLTCWHVVVEKGKLPTRVFVRFADQGHIRTARILINNADKKLDYVVLAAEGPTQQPIPFGPGDAVETFFAFGYRKNEPADGEGTTGDIVALTTLNCLATPRFQLESDGIGKGMSGAPLWSDKAQCGIGMISDRYVPEDSVDVGLVPCPN